MLPFNHPPAALFPRSAPSGLTAWVLYPTRTLTAVIAMALAITASGLVAAVPASAYQGSKPTGRSGLVVGWGYNFYGATTVPAGLTDVISVAAGSRHSLALKSNGTVVAWGLNSGGETLVPAGLTGVTAIAAGAIQWR